MERQWRWKWAGLPWKRSEGLDYYDAVVQIDPTNRIASRTFRRGDPVCVNGDGGNDKSVLWVAQILDFIQVNDDAMLADVELESEVDPRQQKYTRMRCTLRWFYSENDADLDSLTKAGLPEPIDKEFYFTDDIEVPGFNDVQVIVGRAWLVHNQNERMRFMENPDPMYADACDSVCVVRGYVSSQLELTRKLCSGELRRLLERTSGDQMFLSSFEEMTGHPFGTPRRNSARTMGRVAVPQSTEQSSASLAEVEPSRDFAELANVITDSDELSGGPNLVPEGSGSNESDTDGIPNETINRHGAKKPSEAIGKIRAKNISADSDSDDIDTIDTAERAKFRRKYTHTGRHRVRFNREERDDGSDYENEVVLRDRRSKSPVIVRDRVTKPKKITSAASDVKKRLSIEGNETRGERHPRLQRLSRNDSRSRRSNVDVVSRRTKRSLAGSSRLSSSSGPTKMSKGSSSKPTRPSRPSENHLSKFRSLENAKKRDSPVIILGDLSEEPKGQKARPGPPANRSARDNTNEDNIALSTLFPDVTKPTLRVGNTTRKSFEKPRESRPTQARKASGVTRSIRTPGKRIPESSDSSSHDNVGVSPKTRIPSSNSRHSKASLHEYRSLVLKGRETDPEQLRKSKGDSDKVDIDKRASRPMKVGRKRILDDDSPDDDSSGDGSAGDIVSCKKELEHIFGKLSGQGKELVTRNTQGFVGEMLRMITIRTNEGRVSIGEAMMEEIAMDMAKKLTLNARRR